MSVSFLQWVSKRALYNKISSPGTLKMGIPVKCIHLPRCQPFDIQINITRLHERLVKTVNITIIVKRWKSGIYTNYQEAAGGSSQLLQWGTSGIKMPFCIHVSMLKRKWIHFKLDLMGWAKDITPSIPTKLSQKFLIQRLRNCVKKYYLRPITCELWHGFK